MDRMFADRFSAILAILVAGLVASTQPQDYGFVGIIGSYLYWIARFVVEAGLFISIRVVLERITGRRMSDVPLLLGAALLSHVPFVLTVTALDLVLGFPELGIGTGADSPQQRLAAFSMELIYLLDNHLLLCALLSVPGLMLERVRGVNSTSSTQGNTSTTLLSGLEPQLKGDVIWAEAQEHYVRLVTTEETRMVLCRFSDLVRELPQSAGLQIHRSHWVSLRFIAERMQEGQRTTLRLKTGDVVPISRSFRKSLSDRYQPDF